MRRSLLLGWGCVCGMMLFAQEDPVLMRINGTEVSRSEFEYFYHRHTSNSGMKTTPDSYVELFVNQKLKAAAARAAGLDTVSAFRKQQNVFRSSFLKSYLTDERLTDSCARAYYNKVKTNGHSGQVQIMQIFKSLPQTITSRCLEAERTRMDSIYQVINSQSGIDFSHLVEQLSDDKRCVWLESLQSTSELEDIAFSLSKGEVSKPFLTPAGIHIVKVVDQKAHPSYEESADKLSEKVKRVWGLDKGTEGIVEKLKKQYQYTANSAGIEELLNNGETEKTLFVIDGKAFTGEMFKRFSSSHPQSTKRQLANYVAKSILDYESRNLETKHPEIQYAIRENEENALVSQLTFQKIESPIDNDRAALITFFKFHQSDYRWNSPRYKGAVLHCADKKTAKQVKKLLKKVPEREWTETVRKTFNSSGAEKVKVEQGIFADGDNKYIDKLVFKHGGFEPITSYPFTIVVGKKMKGPDDYRMVIDQLKKDYRNYLDACWTRELRGTGKVEINQEVLKTVNND